MENILSLKYEVVKTIRPTTNNDRVCPITIGVDSFGNVTEVKRGHLEPCRASLEWELNDLFSNEDCLAILERIMEHRFKKGTCLKLYWTRTENLIMEVVRDGKCLSYVDEHYPGFKWLGDWAMFGQAQQYPGSSVTLYIGGKTLNSVLSNMGDWIEEKRERAEMFKAFGLQTTSQKKRQMERDWFQYDISTLPQDISLVWRKSEQVYISELDSEWNKLYQNSRTRREYSDEVETLSKMGCLDIVNRPRPKRVPLMKPRRVEQPLFIGDEHLMVEV